MHHRISPHPDPGPPLLPSPRPFPPADARTILQALHRAGGVALTPGQLRERTWLEGGEGYGSPEELVERLEGREDLFHVLAPRRRRWAAAAPRAWIVARQPPPELPGAPPLLSRVRQGLRILAARVNPDSTREMARWERYLLEEARLTRFLERRERRKARRAESEGEPDPPG